MVHSLFQLLLKYEADVTGDLVVIKKVLVMYDDVVVVDSVDAQTMN